MKSINRLQHLTENWKHTKPLLVGTILSAPLVMWWLLEQQFLLSVSPLLTAALTFLLFMWPGLLLALIWQIKFAKFSLGQLSALGFLFSMVISAIPALIFRFNLPALSLIFVTLSIAILLITLKSLRATRISLKQHWADTNPWLVVAFFVMLGLCVKAALNAPIDSDDWAPMAQIRLYLDRPDAIFYFGRVYEMTKYWLIIEALLVKWSGLEAAALLQTYLTPLLLPISFSAFYTLAHIIKPSRNFALFATTLLWIFYVSTPLQRATYEITALLTMNMDKSLLRFILYPLAVAFILNYLSGGRQTYLLLLVITLAVSMFTHMVMFPIFGLTVVTILVTHLLYVPDKRVGLFNSIRVGSVAGLFGLISLAPWMFERMVSNGAGDVTQIDTLALAIRANELLFVTDSQFIVHPTVVFRPVVILAVILLPLVYKDRQQVGAQFLIGGTIIPIVFVLFPPVITFIGGIISPAVTLRLLWLIPAPLVVAYAVWTVIQRVSLTQYYVKNSLIPALILVISAVVLFPQTKDFLSWITKLDAGSRSIDYSIATSDEEELFKYIRRNITSGTILMSENLNNMMRAYVPSHMYGSRQDSSKARDVTNVVYFRGVPQDNRLKVLKFYGQSSLDNRTIDVLSSFDVEYLVVNKDSKIASQMFYLSNDYRLLFENSVFNLFQIVDSEQTQQLVTANVALGNGDTALAITHFKRLIKLDPVNPWFYIGLGQAYEQLNAFEQAVGPYEAAINRSKRDPSVQNTGGIAFLRIGTKYVDPKIIRQTVAFFEREVLKNPDNFESYLTLAESYKRIGRINDTIAVLKRATELFPTDYLGHVHLAQAYFSTNNYKQAIQQYEKALEYAPGNREFYTVLSNLYSQMQQKDNGMTLYQLAVTNNPGVAWPHLELGKFYLEQAMSNAPN